MSVSRDSFGLSEIVDERKDIYIYGAGIRGKMAACVLAERCGCLVKGIVVSDGHRRYDSFDTGRGIVRVIEASELTEGYGRMMILNTVDVGRDSVREFAERSFVSKGAGYHCIADVMVSAIDGIFSSLGVDLRNDDVLNFKGTMVSNPVHVNEGYWGTVIDSSFDILMPSIYGDTRFCDEGPYEYGDVRCAAGDVVVDAGANFGIFSCYAASRGCEVYAFDPDADCLAVLERQRALYPDRFHIMPYALTDTDGERSFFSNDTKMWSSLWGHREHSREVKVQARSIDSLVGEGKLPRVDFIKSDIEGAERLLLSGAKETLKRFRPKLAICTYHRNDDSEVLSAIIHEAVPEYHIEHRFKKLYAYVPN